MIITKQKDFNDLLSAIRDGPVFIVGCNECATLCHTGGEKEVLSMKEALGKKSIRVHSYRLSFRCRGVCLKTGPLTVLGCLRGVEPLLTGDAKGVSPLVLIPPHNKKESKG